MNDIAQVNFREAEQVDWDNYNAGSKFQAPPAALGADGKPLVYYGVLENAVQRANQYAVDAEGNPYLNFLLDPIKLVNAGDHTGYTIRFTEASTKPFEKDGKPVKGNPNKLANFLRATGLQARPQRNSEYIAAVQAVVSRKTPFGFTIDWEAYNKDTGERIKGYRSFPDDPERGGKKVVLKAGDIYFEVDSKGDVTGERRVQSEVLFANARLRFFRDAAPRRG